MMKAAPTEKALSAAFSVNTEPAPVVTPRSVSRLIWSKAPSVSSVTSISGIPASRASPAAISASSDPRPRKIPMTGVTLSPGKTSVRRVIAGASGMLVPPAG